MQHTTKNARNGKRTVTRPPRPFSSSPGAPGEAISPVVASSAAKPIRWVSPISVKEPPAAHASPSWDEAS